MRCFAEGERGTERPKNLFRPHVVGVVCLCTYATNNMGTAPSESPSPPFYGKGKRKFVALNRSQQRAVDLYSHSYAELNFSAYMVQVLFVRQFGWNKRRPLGNCNPLLSAGVRRDETRTRTRTLQGIRRRIVSGLPLNLFVIVFCSADTHSRIFPRLHNVLGFY